MFEKNIIRTTAEMDLQQDFYHRIDRRNIIVFGSVGFVLFLILIGFYLQWESDRVIKRYDNEAVEEKR